MVLRTPIAVVAAALAIAPAAAGAQSASTPVQASATSSPFATCTAGTLSGDTNYVDAEVEPKAAVNPLNPSNLIGVYQQDRWTGGGSHGLVTAYSSDGGTTWGHTYAHFSTCAGGTTSNGGAYGRSSDPWVSIGPDGRAYQSSLSVSANEVTSAVLASTSTDGGQTWTEPKTIITQNSTTSFNDKESITADPNRVRTAYVVWDRSQYPSDSAKRGLRSAALRGAPYFSKTTDGGKTWSTPLQMSSQNIFTIGNQIVVEPDGTLIDVFLFGKGSGRDKSNLAAEGIMRSTNGGATWSSPITISDNQVANDVDPNTGVPLRTGADVGGGLPDIAVNPTSGALYVVWEDSRFSGGAHNDIALSSSSDGGKTWSTPVKVNQTPVPVEAFTPNVSVLPNGTVAVAYYDIRNDPGLMSELLTDYFVADSTDGGSTWSEAGVTPSSFDDTFAPISRGYFLGDYQSLTNDGTYFKAFFVHTNSSTSNRTDVFLSTVTP